MSDDNAKEAEVLKRRIAYVDTLRGMYRFERLVGLIIILFGVGIVVASTYIPTMPHMIILFGYALLAAGWVVFFYVIWKRTAWRKANPFETWNL